MVRLKEIKLEKHCPM